MEGDVMVPMKFPRHVKSQAEIRFSANSVTRTNEMTCYRLKIFTFWNTCIEVHLNEGVHLNELKLVQNSFYNSNPNGKTTLAIANL